MSDEIVNSSLPDNHNGTQEKLPTTIGEYSSIDDFAKSGLSLIVEATKAVNSFPFGATRDLYCAYPTFGKVVDAQSDRILGIISEVLKRQNIRGNIQRRQKDEQFELILESNDAMLERINSDLDELAGIRKNPQTVLIEATVDTTIRQSKGAGSWNAKTTNNSNSHTARLITAKNIARPQTSFKIPVDNSVNNPFEPKIKDKPNSLKPLAVLPEYDEEGNIESYLHPYEFELDKFEPPPDQLLSSTADLPKKVENTPLMYVDTDEKLKELIKEIKSEKILAIDLEHHSYRSFQGITCLMQISTNTKDYIVDTLQLREELHKLNEVFTNPKVLKIFHGADLDIEWLQRDLSLYVVNMFDTHQAAKLLGFPRLSLAYLLRHYCGIDADKTFQLADWRMRPLPAELIKYARQDTHFLIYIYELLRNELLKKGNDQPNLLRTVYQKSAEICKKRYIKPKVHNDSHIELYRKSKRIFDNRQLYALKEMFLWRDKISRQEDESYAYVLPNHMMLQICETLPREMQGILACCNPIPPLVRQNLHAIHQIVLKAREQPLVKPIIQDAIENRVGVPTSKDINSKLYCPHDLSHSSEFRDDLPTLLGPIKFKENSAETRMPAPSINIFEVLKIREASEVEQKLEKLKEVKFITPYERYKAVIPFAEKQRLEEVSKENEISKSKMLCPVKVEKEPVETVEVKKESDDDMYSLPLKRAPKRKQKENNNIKLNKDSKKLKNNDISEEQNKLEFVPKIVTEKPKKLKDTVFNINVKDKQTDRESSSHEILELDDAGEVKAQAEQSTSGNNRSTGKKKTKKRKQFDKKPQQSSSQPVQFDYSKVSFKNFQGGSQKSKGTEIKPKFQGKGQGNKANNKKFNKLFTFSNVKNKKK